MLAIILFTGLVTAEQPQPERLDALLEPIRAAKRLPALAAAVVQGGDIVAIGAVGFRKNGAPDRVTLDDQWHIGSCTKSMTAVLAAMLVEKGTWKWDTTLADMFPKLAPKMQPGWRAVTLEQLLTHHGGAPADLNKNGLWGRLWDRGAMPPIDQREYLTRELLIKQSPAAPPGTKFIYSNAGYALVGHAIELQLGRPWEDVICERLFKPLGMDSAGFGTPGSVWKVDEPWGHSVGGTPIPPGLKADNPAAIGPAGAVHCSIGDLAKYAAFQMRGGRAEGTLLKPETFKKLHTPFGHDSDYACGWIVTQRLWGDGEVLYHNGSNTHNFTVIWLAPKRDFAVVVSTNLGGNIAEKAVDQTAGQLIQKFFAED
jgi:CubicO group peptidase (beta-lactamase class C family)